MASLDCQHFSDWPWRFWATHRPNATAIIRGLEPVSWHRLIDEVNAVSAGFYQCGVRRGHGVALRGKNSPEILVAYLAALQLGARVLPVNPLLADSLQAQLFPLLNIDYGWCAQRNEWPIGVQPLSSPRSSGERPLSNYIAPWPSDCAVTMTLTSGSSGLPKAAVHRPEAHLANADGLLQMMEFEAGDSWLLSLPLFHVSGQGIVWRWLLKGATLVQRELHPLTDALYGCTHASLVPTQLWRLLEQTADSFALKQVLLGGAAIPIELTDRATKQGIACWCGYGMTEMASTVCAKRANDTSGVGVPLPGREMRIVEREVWLRGSGQASGYWRNGKIHPFTDQESWFHTRDRGEWKDDELYISGRLDNLFFSGGEGIQPEDIERVLVSHPQVDQAFVVPVDNVEFGQRPVAVIDANAALDLAQLSDWLRGRIARFQIPDAYYFLPSGLKTGGIKISRLAVREWVNKVHRAL
ncbi:o-succinylbenzoate--CoA ligase [Budvicia diplopodorum]|uniref:o-succinylbenzoate--CoA ligase n=1 Tax=Budvicia diplopodorum TaxID=1119056 RepID=UPI00135B78A7|nr:o-succinylbenzoate--CoA ligase [Budvicia diplopodorum]